MFGHQDDQQDHHDQQATDNLIPGPTIDGILSSDPLPAQNMGMSSVNPPLDQPISPIQFSPQPPVDAPTTTPSDSPAAAPVASTDQIIVPTQLSDLPTSTPDNAEPVSEPMPAETAHTNDLLDIKQQALTQLTPLVGHLDQSPEEKFRTTMMMIQASDNQGLISTAYEAAQAIPDEKSKAQALLDIVNEINYFTQAHAASAQQA